MLTAGKVHLIVFLVKFWIRCYRLQLYTRD